MKDLGVYALAGAVLVFAGVTFFSDPVNIAMEGGQIVKETVREVGAVTGPELTSPYWIVNGVQHEYRHKAFLTQGSTTACSFQTPNATSSLLHSFISFNTASSGATEVTFAYGASNDATTTLLGSGVIPGDSKGTLVGSTSVNSIVAPSQFLNFTLKGHSDPTRNAPTGQCGAVFQVTG